MPSSSLSEFAPAAQRVRSAGGADAAPALVGGRARTPFRAGLAALTPVSNGAQPGHGSGGAAKRRAFTLLEVLLVLAIIGLIASVLVGGAVQLLNDKPVSADEVFWKAVQEARKTALKSEKETTLKFVTDDQNKVKKFVVSNGDTTKDFPIANADDLEVSFLTAQAGGNLIMVAGTVLDTKQVPAVTFYGDGTCTAFRVQFFRNGAAHIAAIDPWTCAPVLTPTKPDGTPATPAS